MMEQVYNNPNIDFEIAKPIIGTIHEKMHIDSNDYIKLEYSNFLKMRFKPVEGKKADTLQTKNALEKQFGLGKVTYDPQTNFYKILVFKNVIANSLDSKKWTFVIVEERQKPILEKILPKELL